MDDILDRLQTIIADRLANGRPDESYVAMLAAKGPTRIARKLGEEATETVIAALAESDEALVGEAADLLFHLLILLGSRGLGLDEVRASAIIMAAREFEVS